MKRLFNAPREAPPGSMRSLSFYVFFYGSIVVLWTLIAVFGGR
jgi:hypothetical protein